MISRLPEALRPIRTHAERVACPRQKCLQPAGQTCINPLDGKPLVVQPAHNERIREADHTAALAEWCQQDRGGCGAAPGTRCTDGLHPLNDRHPDHEIRLRIADVWREPVELPREWPRRRHPDALLAAGKVEYRRAQVLTRHAALQRRSELRADIRAGDMDEARRAELIDLDRLIADTDPEPTETPAPPVDPDEPEQHWRRGPGGHR